MRGGVCVLEPKKHRSGKMSTTTTTTTTTATTTSTTTTTTTTTIEKYRKTYTKKSIKYGSF